MKISIITVCYNEAGTIENTLQSIFSQTYQNIESIIIDGKSTDGTLDIIEKYRNKIAYFISEPDEGIYNAMNKGIKASTGDVLYFLNANDTLYSDDVIEAVVNCFKKGGYDFVYGNINHVYPEENELSDYKQYSKNRNYHALLSKQICHQACFYKKSLFDKLGLYDENFVISADHDFNMKILTDKKLKTCHIRKVIANFKRLGISTCEKNEKIRENENRLIFHRYAFQPPFSKICYYIKWLFTEPQFLFHPKKLSELRNRIKKLI